MLPLWRSSLANSGKRNDGGVRELVLTLHHRTTAPRRPDREWGCKFDRLHHPTIHSKPAPVLERKEGKGAKAGDQELDSSCTGRWRGGAHRAGGSSGRRSNCYTTNHPAFYLVPLPDRSAEAILRRASAIERASRGRCWATQGCRFNEIRGFDSRSFWRGGETARRCCAKRQTHFTPCEASETRRRAVASSRRLPETF